MLRLIAVVDHQRRELDRIRAAAASDSVVAMARGALMERLGVSSAEAARQPPELSAATGIALEEMAAAVLAGQLAAPDLTSPDLTAPDLTAPDLTGPDLSGGGLTGPGLTGPGRPGSAPRAGGSAAVTAATRAGRQAPPRPGSLLAETAAELAADGTELAAMLAGQLLAPLGAASVVLWLLGSDGALTLLGEAGLAVG